jgi:hypothetical protein
MAKLVLSSEGAIVQQRFVDKDVVNIGRREDNELVIDDAAVRPRHAAIVPVGNDHILEDRDGGTRVNGTAVSRHILQHGDVIQLGAFYLRYLNPRATSELDLERTMLIAGLHVPDEPSPEAASRASGAPVAPRARARAQVRFPSGCMRVTAGARAGTTVALDRVITILGKPGGPVAVVARRPRGFFATHVEGRRRPRVNGRSLGTESRPLRHGDVLEVADEAFELVLEQAS